MNLEIGVRGLHEATVPTYAYLCPNFVYIDAGDICCHSLTLLPVWQSHEVGYSTTSFTRRCYNYIYIRKCKRHFPSNRCPKVTLRFLHPRFVNIYF